MSTHPDNQVSSTQSVNQERNRAGSPAQSSREAQDAMPRVEHSGVTRLSFFGCSIEIGDVAATPLLAAVLGC